LICANCDAELEPVFDSQEGTQYIDALHIQLHFGYGEFHDHGPDETASPEMFFCKDCTTVLVKFFPGFRKQLGPVEIKQNVFEQKPEDNN